MMSQTGGRTIFGLADALLIVTEADLTNLDDRFIVALAGAENTFGATANSLVQAVHAISWGYYNSFDNIQHCAALGYNAFCQVRYEARVPPRLRGRLRRRSTNHQLARTKPCE